MYRKTKTHSQITDLKENYFSVNCHESQTFQSGNANPSKDIRLRKTGRHWKAAKQEMEYIFTQDYLDKIYFIFICVYIFMFFTHVQDPTEASRAPMGVL